MEREIQIELKYPYQGLMKGIYRIQIGDKFYIGKAKRFARRMYQHEKGINECLAEYPMPPARCSHYWRIAKYLHENPKITILYAEVIQKCVTELDLYNMENRFLMDAENNPDCLNGMFFNSRSGLDDSDTWDTLFIGDTLYYYNPSDLDEPIMSQFTKLTKYGNPRRPTGWEAKVNKQKNKYANS